ncbi:serine--pyruvate aminotransferase-like [Anneissia japonica]|uniref:serine--pyruvate aminotransferase-like n=1 Tax=Anneissia japonica TaxID=1529436 RepID=UPI0014256008|nr:serine--pyruvate aminotransferase-like [Anneissia japonica]
MLSRRVGVVGLGFISRQTLPYYKWNRCIASKICTSSCNLKKCNIDPPSELFQPMNVPHKLLTGPGPSNCPPRVLEASALPLLGHLHAEFIQIMDDIKAGIQYAFQTKNALTLAISGTGHAGMEAAAVNILQPGDVILVGVNGLWGQRLASLAERIGADVRLLEKPAGQIFTPEEVAQAVKEHKPCAFFITQGESSSGLHQPIEGFGEVCHAHDCLLFVDTVASLGGLPMFADDWGVDVIYTGSQKVLGCPPGTAPISFSQKACEKLASRKTKVLSYYFDMNELGNYWGADDQPRRYHHTGPISNFYTLREGLAMLVEEQIYFLEAEEKKTKLALTKFGPHGTQIHFSSFLRTILFFVKSLRLPTVTAVEVPDGVNWKEVTDYIMKKYKIEISGGLGETAGKIWRIGLMGYNCNEENVTRIVNALDDALTTLHK